MSTPVVVDGPRDPRSCAGPPRGRTAVTGRPGASERAQALVELALIAPLIFLLFAAGIDGSRLAIMKADQDRKTALVAAWAAAHPGDDSYHAIAADQFAAECTIQIDDTGKPGIVTASSTCHFEPLALHGLWEGLPVSSSESAVVSGPTPSPTPEPSPSESVTP